MAIKYASGIQPGGAFPITEAQYLKGGYRSVKTEKDRENINKAFLEDGALCLVTSTLTCYQYKIDHWEVYNMGGSGGGSSTPIGIPILTKLMVDNMGEDVPNKYVQIPDESDLNLKDIKNNNYIDILFSALRALQAEVARLKNSFLYGINSYNETLTAISDIYGSYSQPDEEPLWAVEEDSLSILTECTFEMGLDSPLQGTVEIDTTNKVLKITDGIFIDPEKGFKAQPDPKSFLYLTLSNKNVKFNLKSDIDLVEINLGQLNIPLVLKYNVLLIVSKRVKKDNIICGYNYIWISVTDYYTNNILLLGYFNGTNFQESKFELNNSYYINKVHFWDTHLYKFNSYTKYLDFSLEIIPTYPSDTDYKLGVAHITIRSVKNSEVLKRVKDLLQNNELIWEEDTKKLNIKSNGKIYAIGSTGGGDDETMTLKELISYLDNLGIKVSEESAGKYKLTLENLVNVTFIHQDTGKKFRLEIDSEGNLKSTLENDNTIAKRINGLVLPEVKTRGLISKMRLAEYNHEHGTSLTGADSNVGLMSDRVKIGSIYAPRPGRTLYGCSHAFVELENTSDKEVCLKGCQLHMITHSSSGDIVHSLPLTGTLPAGGTYLIRGKQYTKFDDINTVLKVKTYDQEWYIDGQLADLQLESLGLMLFYHPIKEGLIESDVKITAQATYVTKPTKSLTVADNFIDIAFVRNNDYNWISDKAFAVSDEKTTRDYILKNTFELDPAKLAFLAINEKDSSRVRGFKTNDFKPFYIDILEITFPHTDEKCKVSLYTPKASFEHKNVSTDKTKLDYNKPNMVYCLFGINMHTTRCFSWVSVGYFDEYVWVRKKGTLEPWIRFESYKKLDILKTIPEASETVLVSQIELKPESEEVHRVNYYLNAYAVSDTAAGTSKIVYVGKSYLNNYAYARMSGRFPGDGTYYTAHKCIIEFNNPVIERSVTYEYIVGRALKGEPDPEHTSKIMNFTLYPENTEPRIFLVTDQLGFYWIEYLTWAGAALAVKDKIEEQFNVDYHGPTYMPIIINTGDMTQNGTRVNEWIDYYKAGECLFDKYEHMSVVGNNDLANTDIEALGTGDDEGKSNGYFHHLFFCFLVEDNDDLLVRTPNPDSTKVWEDEYKFIPSTYYCECKLPEKTYKIIGVNSEITYINCRDWFKLKTLDPGDNTPGASFNIYTGWEVGDKSPLENPKYLDNDTFTPIYNTLYKWFLKSGTLEIIVACHEMPFTVITRENMSTKSPGYYIKGRSVDGKDGGKLIGSHLNLINEFDTISNQWFSRLLESNGIKLVIGGHKHTYACTYPVREFYFYKENGVLKNSLLHGPMKMESSLINEYNTKTKESLVTWSYTKLVEDSLFINDKGNFKEIVPGTEASTTFNSFFADELPFNTSRLPIVKFQGQVKMISESDGKTEENYTNSDLSKRFLPIIGNSALMNGVVYFMCQATGYKQTSNKELPGSAQAFTMLLPLTSAKLVGDKIKDTASPELLLPMFGIIKYTNNKFLVLLLRVLNVLKANAVPLYNETGKFGTAGIEVQYIDNSQGTYSERRFGKWDKKETNIIEI